MRKINLTRLMLIGAMAGVILLFAIGEIAFQYVRQSGWDTYFPKEGFDALAIDPQGQVWANRQYGGGFVIFDGNSWREQPLPSNSPLTYNFVRAIAFDQEGRTWVGTLNGIGVLNGDVWTSYTSKQNSRLKGYIEAIVEDQEQQVWIATSGSSGVEVFDGKSWRSYSEPITQLPGTHVVEIAADSLGLVWFGLSGGNFWDCDGTGIKLGNRDSSGVSVYDDKVWTSYSWKQMGLNGPYLIKAIAVDKKNQVWVGTNGGLHVFDGNQWKTVFEETESVHESGPRSDICIQDIAVDPQGKVWILMGGGRLGIFDGEKWLRLDDRSVNLPDYSESLAITPSGHAWIASSFDGLRTTSTVQPPVLPSGLMNIRYWLTLTLGVSFWMLLGLASVVGSKKEDTDGTMSRGGTSQNGIRIAWRYIVFGSGIGFLVALVGGSLHDFVFYIGSGGDLVYTNFNFSATYSYYAGPIAGAVVGFILGTMARFQDESTSERRIGIVIGAITGALYGIVQGVANSYPGLSDPFMPSEGVWLYVVVIASFQALIGMLLGGLGGFLFLRKASAPPSV